MNEGHLLAFLIGGAIGLFIGYIIGGAESASEAMNEAVEKGKAEYYLDEENQKQWRWKP